MLECERGGGLESSRVSLGRRVGLFLALSWSLSSIEFAESLPAKGCWRLGGRLGMLAWLSQRGGAEIRIYFSEL